ncbi:hypothetical protein ACFVS2_25340 [Brevibacillus sp. NPDC058079]|uniref:hypothetical protein n=1 Tax=Brevibacillus sp. NPDC058079 TaxID=3346330 RepID=UPI0036EA9A0B
MKKFFFANLPFFIIGAILLFVLGAFFWKQSMATYYTIDRLQYERVEPEKDWRSYDYVIFVSETGQKIKFLCPENVYQSMVYESKYDVTIIEGDISLPDTKVVRVVPSN